MSTAFRTRFLPRRSGALVLAVLLMATAMAIAPRRALAGNEAPVTVTIQRFVEIDDPDTGITEKSHGTYYGIVDIGNNGDYLDSRNLGYPEQDDTPDISPNWRFTRSVDRGLGTVGIRIQVKGDNTGVPFTTDDVMDITPAPGLRELHITLNLSTGSWSGDNGDANTFSQGNGDSERGKILFNVSMGDKDDFDGDGIPNWMERAPMRDIDGKPLVDMALLGADPCRKNVALWMDWEGDSDPTHSRQPDGNAIQKIKDAFNNSSVDPPDGQCPYTAFSNQGGVGLIVVQGKQVMWQATTDLGAVDGIKKAANPDKDPIWRYFHYVLFANSQSGSSAGSSGRCCSPTVTDPYLAKRDILVTLGSGFTGPNGSTDEQTGTVMHELGHALGLAHGGADTVNCKPNYLSVMSYVFQFTGIPTTDVGGNLGGFRFDYSREALGKDDGTGSKLIDEANLDETVAIGTRSDYTMWTTDGGATTPHSIVNQKINWDNDAPATFITNATVDVNNWTTARTDDCPPTDSAGNRPSNAKEKLAGFDDWKHIKFVSDGVSAIGAGHDAPDATAEVARFFREAWAKSFAPDVKVDLAADKAAPAPGDVVTYTATVTNLGTGPATHVSLDNVLPDGSKVTRSVPDLAPGASKAETFTFTVPCDAADKAVLVDTAHVAAVDELARPEGNATNNDASFTATVAAPVVTLATTAAPTVDAGGAATYTVTYENTGTGSATGVKVVATLPPEVYYSTALDQGSGPRPSTVVHNADGTTMLTWSVATVGGSSGSQAITFTARPSLLVPAGTVETAAVTLSYSSASGCRFDDRAASASTAVTTPAPSRDPLSLGYWRNHDAEWTSEMLARIQATDQRFDGADGSAPDGRLVAAEMTATFAPPGGMPRVTGWQLLATYFNLATRRISATTAIGSKVDTALGLAHVRDAGLYAQATLNQPVSKATQTRYSDTTDLLDEINNNRSERY